MSAPLKVILMLVIWFLYSLLAYQGCVKECCPGSAEEGVSMAGDTSAAAAAVAARHPIDFQWASAAPFTNEGFERLKQSLLSQLGENNILEITGLYFEAEPKPEGYENMGFARADQIKALLIPDIPADRIRPRARLVDEKEGVREGYFEAASFSWIQPEAAVEATVEELDDRIIIRFPFGSVEKEYDPKVDEYLNKLAGRIKQTQEQVRLTGHTDNVDDEEFNQSLGERRAKEIRDLLINKGVSQGQIIVESRGESQPVDSNDSEQGRHNNRRVEVRLIKKTN